MNKKSFGEVWKLNGRSCTLFYTSGSAYLDDSGDKIWPVFGVTWLDTNEREYVNSELFFTEENFPRSY